MTNNAPRRKMILSTLMLLLTLALWLCGYKPWEFWAIGAIFCSWIADALLAKYPPFLRKVPGAFFIGASLFALAHACYAAASIMILRSFGLPFRWRSFAVLMALFARSSKRATGFTVAASSYLMVVGAMSALAIRVAAESGGRLWVLPLGACLFFLSDCILVVREYRREKSAVMTGMIWSTYLAAQALLQLGLWLC
jgi:hypothetical protein